MKNLFQSTKSKVVALASTGAILATQAQAAVTYDGTAGFGGTIDMTAFNTALPLVVTVIGVVIATTLGIRALKGAKSA